MARYIDADKLMRRIETEAFRWGIEYDLSQIMGDIEDFPTADVEEVKHGEWKDIYQNKYVNHLYICSICSAKALYRVETDALYHTEIKQDLSLYCPCCGAKMDGERK